MITEMSTLQKQNASELTFVSLNFSHTFIFNGCIADVKSNPMLACGKLL